LYYKIKNMYKVKELIDKGLKVSSLDKELQDDIEALETLSDNYFNDDKDALDFDNVLAKELAKHMKDDKPKPKKEKKAKKEKAKKMDLPDCDELATKYKKAYEKRQAKKNEPKPTPSEKFEKKAESAAKAVVSSVKGSDVKLKKEVQSEVKSVVKGILAGFKSILASEDEDTLKRFNADLEKLIAKYKK
jgi:hypothetical protein